MSHVAKIELVVKDLAALRSAAQACGLELVEGQKKYKWWGHSVGDYPIPKGFTAEDLGKCDHALRVKGNPDAYEIGVVRRRDGQPGFELLFDFYGSYGAPLRQAVGQDGGKLKQEYAASVATRHYQSQGFVVRRSLGADGKIVLTCDK
jgi:hypothetical protein